MKTAKYPYFPIHCPYTHETILAKEEEIERDVWSWTYRGRPYDNLDDIIASRSKMSPKN